MIPDPETLSGRFGIWLLDQPEASADGPGVPVIDLMNIMGNIVHLMRQSLKAIEIPHVMSYIGYKSELVIREQGGLWLYGPKGERFRIPLAEETDQDSNLIDLLNSVAPDDISDLED